MRFRRLGKQDLFTWRTKALRGRVWFNVLTRLERGLVDSVIQVVDVVRSRLLVKVLSSIVEKLQTALESRILRMIRIVGVPMAGQLSKVAKSWGNESATEWVTDPGFASFLAIMTLNSPQYALQGVDD